MLSLNGNFNLVTKVLEILLYLIYEMEILLYLIYKIKASCLI